MANAKKIEDVKLISEILGEKGNVFFVDFTGLDANKTILFRREIREKGGIYKVFKNRLFKIAAKNNNMPTEIEEFTRLTTGFVFIGEDPTGVAKALKKWEKENETFKIKGGFYIDRILGEEEIAELSKIPSKDELLGRLLYLLNSPLTRFIGVLKANQRDLVAVLKQVSEKKK